jgi:ceramide glucosyltransferase
MDGSERERVMGALSSFAADLGCNDELLIGCHAADSRQLARWLESPVAADSRGSVKLISDDEPSRLAANPKVSWCRILAPHASGELWLWSDADVIAPPGTLDSLRADFSRQGVGLVTSPYVIRNQDGAPGLLDELFVNAEFYPGVLLTARLGLVRFAFGSGMLFEAERFSELVDWDELGSLLADDHELGRRLGPSRLGSMTLLTQPTAVGWRAAVLHYLRWHKTVRWVEPASYAAQLVVVPVVGWMVWALLRPTDPAVWIGLASLVVFEAAAAVLSCRLVGSRVPIRCWPLVVVWAMLRGVTSVACWLPWPVVWRGQLWWSPRNSRPTSKPTVDSRETSGAE